MNADNVKVTPKAPIYEDLEHLVATTAEENKRLRAELAEAREKNKRFVYESLNMYRKIESLLVENDNS